MRIVIEIDEQRTPAPPPEVSVMRGGPAGASGPAGEQVPAAGEMDAINAGSAAPLAESGTTETMPEGMSDAPASDASGAMSAGPAPEADATG